MNATQVSSDDKLMAAIGYWGSIILWLIPALVIFVLKKDQSPYIRKHALQSLALNGALTVVWIALIVINVVIGAITFGIGSLLVMLVQVGVFLGALLYFVLLGLWVFQGENPDIPMLTEMIDKNLSA